MASTNKDKLKELLGKIAVSTNTITVEEDINQYTILELLNALRSNVTEINKILDNLDEELLDNIRDNPSYIESQKLIRLGVDFSGNTDEAVIENNTRILQNVINNLKDGETLYLPAGMCCINKTIEVNKKIKLFGTGDIVTFHLTDKKLNNTIICKVNGDTDGNSVLKINGSNTWGTEITNIVLTGCNTKVITYSDAVLTKNASTKCTSYGLFITGTQDCVCTRVGATQCKVAGIYSEKGAVHEFNNCSTTQNFVGQIVKTTDGSVNVCHHHHNIEDGLIIKGNYTRVNNCRFEWNGKHGILSESAENQYTGNLFDRNGYAGLAITKAWGHTVVGNYFSRNGSGGDGTVGRWDFSVPGHPSYIEVPEDECCHIKLDYQRDVTITGNRYRNGKDDSNKGTNSPCCIYYCINAVHCLSSGNAGERLGSGGHGGFTNHPTYTNGVEKLTKNSKSLFGEK